MDNNNESQTLPLVTQAKKIPITFNIESDVNQKEKIPIKFKIKSIVSDVNVKSVATDVSIFKDKIKGMLVGLALGDALGVPFEFRSVEPKIVYNGLIPTHAIKVRTSKYHQLDIPAGAISDDTEMTLALLRCLVTHQGHYNKEDIIVSYMTWANQCRSLGKNTRRLFKGIKTVRGYENRFAKIDDDEKQHMQSNGSLMRCSPLAFIKDETAFEKAVKKDVYLTNPNQVNLEANVLYLSIIRMLLHNATKNDIIEYLTDYSAQTEELQQVIIDVVNPEDERAIDGKVKGWVCSALYVSLKALLQSQTFQEAIDWIIGQHKGSDTDTNAAIGGCVIGCLLGYQQMSQETKTSVNMTRSLDYYHNANHKDKAYLMLDIDQLVDSINSF